MAKRTIKSSVAPSRITIEQATTAARVVYRDVTTGRLVIIEPDRPLKHRKASEDAFSRKKAVADGRSLRG